MRKILVISLLLFLFGISVPAQSFRPVLHDVQTEGKKTVNLSRGIMLIDPKGVFSDDLDFLDMKSKGLPLTVDFGPALAGVKPCPGAYQLETGPKGISIAGYDEKGAANGIQTLRRLVADSKDMRVPVITVNDWPDIESGFSDIDMRASWSHDFRLEMINVAGRLKMKFYAYSPSDDSCLSGPDWYMPYPQGKADEIKELIEACRRHRMDFIWCIRPDSGFTWSESDYSLLLGKFEMMHYLGVRSFGIFFDNVPVSDGMEQKKKDLVDRLNAEFIAGKKDLKPLMTDVGGCYAPEYGRESAKLGLYAAADKAWNPGAYDPMKSLEWAVNEIAPDISGHYLTYARHSEDVCGAFAMEVSSGVDLIGLDGFDDGEYETLMAEFKEIESLPDSISGTLNQGLYADLKPWVEELGKLGARGRRVLECISFYRSGDVPRFWSTYAANLMSADDMKSYAAYPAGRGRLHPYYERMMKELADAFDSAYKGKVGYTFVPGDGIQTYIAPDEASFCHLILDNPEGREVIVRLSDGRGRYTAEFCIDVSYFEFEMKEDAVKVEVIGDVPVFETVFVK